ncbi:enoyl-CoA delta isomerase 1, mitochondrial-like [Orussus abietinus]|uniref:enoyl-CoA delta isomerase 1, mitochondrial-like n=1 Tax=Orussus abietinus TaxID=222816 RepID=UPI000626ACA3|nr:enoyl-CoA delta isomerase 1, mitochondrial-like [Orussus abietinus]
MIPLVRILSKRQWTLACRTYATSGKLVEATVNEKSGISTISMARPPVNGLNFDLLTELKETLQRVESDGSKGVILTSSLPTVFSGGLDIMEMYKPDLKRATNFWHALQDAWLVLYGLGIPTAAAINGASPAGGCLLAMACEYRVFVEGKHTIGLNETKLGIIAPKWFQDSYISTIGHREAELALLRGSLFPPQEALKIGLVDELASDKQDAINKCDKYINYYAKIPGDARKFTKLEIRKNAMSWLESNRDLDTNIFLTYIQHPKVQTGLDLYVKSLKQK